LSAENQILLKIFFCPFDCADPGSQTPRLILATALVPAISLSDSVC
jgi:hypothetical protein